MSCWSSFQIETYGLGLSPTYNILLFITAKSSICTYSYRVKALNNVSHYQMSTHDVFSWSENNSWIIHKIIPICFCLLQSTGIYCLSSAVVQYLLLRIWTITSLSWYKLYLAVVSWIMVLWYVYMQVWDNDALNYLE